MDTLVRVSVRVVRGLNLRRMNESRWLVALRHRYRRGRLLMRLLAFSRQHRLPAIATVRKTLRAAQIHEESVESLLNIQYPRNREEVNATFVLNREYLQRVLALNRPDRLPLLQDKAVLFRRFPRGTGRAFIDLRDTPDAEALRFIRHARHIVAKRNFGFGASKLRIFDPRDGSAEQILADIHRLGLDFLEPCITQHDVLHRLYPHAVNTLRIHTINNGREVRLFLRPKLRIGADGAYTDIGSRTQYRALVDRDGSLLRCVRVLPSTRIIKATEHHNSTVAFADVKLPYIDDSIALVQDAARAFPEIPFIGWDVALTEAGPILVEGNGVSGAFRTYQAIEYLYRGQGLRDEFEGLRRFCLETEADS